MFKQTIKMNILTIFLLLLGLVATALLTSQYYFNHNLAIDSTEKTFKVVSSNVSHHLTRANKRIKDILYANADNENFTHVIDFNVFTPVLKNFTQIMKTNSDISSVYFAHEDSSFYRVINMTNSLQLYTKYNAPKRTKWMIILQSNKKILHAFLDKNLSLLSKNFVNVKYNPTTRLWYKNAIKSDSASVTEPYFFLNLKEPGVTYSIQTKKSGTVFSIDYTMKNYNNLLKIQDLGDDSEVFLFDKNGKKLSSSNQEKNIIKKNILNKDKIKFTKEEENFIKNLHTLRVSNENSWAPFDFHSAGKPLGYSIDLLSLISQKSGLKIEYINGYNWSELMDMFKDKDLDLVHSLYKTSERESIGNFTQAIYSFKNHFITNKNSKKINAIKDLYSKKVAVVKGWVLEKYLKERYPKIIPVLYEDAASAFLALSQNRVHAIIDTQESFKYMTNQLYIDNLKTDAWFKEFDNNQAQSIYILVQKESPLLLSILNKTITSLNKTQVELKQLHKKWFSAEAKNTQTDMIDFGLMQSFLNSKEETIIKYSQDSNNYFTMFEKTEKKGVYIGIKLNTYNLFKPYNENMRSSFLIAVLLLLVSIPIIFFLTNLIVKPINLLTKENEKIQNRKFSEVTSIDTHIIEFSNLSNSLTAMSKSIEEFQIAQAKLLDSIVKLIAEAVDAKSPYTGGHCERVPEIAQMLISKASESQDTVFKDFSLTTKDELRAFEIGAWLHDCGKVTTPEYVVDKSTKLETINDRIHEVRTRFEVLWRDAQITYLKSKLQDANEKQALEILNATQSKLLDDFSFIANANIGGEFMSPDKQNRVKEIADQEWTRHFDDSLGLGEIEILRYDRDNAQELPATEKLLSDKKQHIIKRENFNHEAYERDGFKEEVPENLYNYGEVYNLCIAKGTLSPEERYKINEHVILTIKMLEKIPFPAHLAKVPEYAGTHHETLIGTGYPRKLTKDELSIPSRIMAMADVFEALTASDRPYKKAKTLSASVKILSFMVKDKHLDEDIFKLFLKSGLHITYAKKYLKPEQIDEVDIERYI